MGYGSRINPFGRDSQVAGPPIVRDQLGRELQVGDEVLVTQPAALCRVTQITPVMHPGAPPNLMQIRLVAVLDINVPRGVALETVFRTREAKDLLTQPGLGKSEKTEAPQAPPADPPPTDPPDDPGDEDPPVRKILLADK